MNVENSPVTSAPLRAAPVAGYFYRPELDVLRFFAFLLVFMYHVVSPSGVQLLFRKSPPLAEILNSVFTAMACGVCLFFMLSAYLITTLLIRERESTGLVNLTSFYERRILRIWPLYFFVLLLAFVASSLVHGFPGFKTIAAYTLMAGNLSGLLHLHSDIRPLKIFHLWSISVEEQFYLVFPFVFRMLPLRWLPAISGTVVLVMIGTILHVCGTGGAQGILWYSSGVQFVMFAAGILIAYIFSIRGLPRWKPWLRVLCLGVGCFACFCAEYIFHIQIDGFHVTASQAISGYLFVMFGCSLILVGTLGIAASPPKKLIYLGKISYGLYVFHIWALSLATYLMMWMAKASLHDTKTPQRFVLAKDLLAFLLTILIASASYRWLEKPFLKLKRRFEIIQTRAA